MAQDKASCARMASPRLLRVPLPSYPVRHVRATAYPLSARRRSGVARYSAVYGRPVLWRGRSQGGLSSGHLPQDIVLECRAGEDGRSCDFFFIHGLAGLSGGTERSICDQSQCPVEELEERKPLNGVAAGIHLIDSEGRSISLHGYSEAVPSFLPGSGNARLVHLPLRWRVLSKRCASIWMGTISSFVHSNNGCVRPGASSQRAANSRLFGRLSYCSILAGNCFNSEGLFSRAKDDRTVIENTWSEETFGQGRVDGVPETDSSWCSLHEIQGLGAQGIEGAKTSRSIATSSTVWTSLGTKEACRAFLWYMLLAFLGYALGSLLHKVAVLRHSFESAPRYKGKMQAQPQEYERSWILEEDDWCEDGRSVHSISSTWGFHAHGCRRHRVRRYSELRGLSCRGAWPTAGSRNLELERSGDVNHLPRIAGNSNDAHEKARTQYSQLRLSGHILHVDNQAVVHITNAFVSSSRSMMRELRILKRVLDALGLRIRSEWLPSEANKYADVLSRRFPREDLQLKQTLRRSVLDGIAAPQDAFPYRPLGEHPVFFRRQTWRELYTHWDSSHVRLLCPPVDMIPQH